MSPQQSVQFCLLGALLLCTVRISLAQNLTWQETSFQANGQPQTITIPPHTVMFQCGMKSSFKQKYNITSDIAVYAYTVEKADLKDVKIKGEKLSFTFERRSACANRTVCKASSSGRIISFEKCFVLTTALNSKPTTVILEFTSKWDDKVLVVYVFLGLVVLLLGVVVCCVLSRACHCVESCDCCAGVWYYYGKGKRKGYSPYQVSAV